MTVKMAMSKMLPGQLKMSNLFCKNRKEYVLLCHSQWHPIAEKRKNRRITAVGKIEHMLLTMNWRLEECTHIYTVADVSVLILMAMDVCKSLFLNL